jgi:pimeloyl-ACP methyl ester carboxylesterase
MPTVAANGLNIHDTEHGAGQPLVLLHTGTATGQMWEQQVSALARAVRQPDAGFSAAACRAGQGE